MKIVTSFKLNHLWISREKNYKQWTGGTDSLVTGEPVSEFEKWLVEAQDVRKITNPFRGIYGIYLKGIKKKTERSQHVTSWTGKHEDFDWLCPELSLDTDSKRSRWRIFFSSLSHDHITSLMFVSNNYWTYTKSIWALYNCPTSLENLHIYHDTRFAEWHIFQWHRMWIAEDSYVDISWATTMSMCSAHTSPISS